MGKVTERIDSVLKEKGIPKQEFYSACKITSSAYSQWNTGKTEPRLSKLRTVAEYLNVNYEWLAFGSGQKEKPLINGDEELTEYLEELRTRPECRMLFSLAKGATKEDVEKAVAIIEALRKAEGR